jgi:hypothetical protein
MKLHPKFKFRIIFHSGGVTRRPLEIPKRVIPCSFLVKDDFKDYEVAASNRTLRIDMRVNLKKVLKKIGNLSRVLISDVESGTMLPLKSWTLEIRSSYTHQSISLETLRQICVLLRLNPNLANQISDQGIVHQRLGDLLNLRSKHFLPVERIEAILNLDENSKKQFVILTESPAEASSLFRSEIRSRLSFCHLSTLETISKSLQVSTFIGSNSKISLWIALFRTMNEETLNTSKTYLPLELQPIFNSVAEALSKRVCFYS